MAPWFVDGSEATQVFCPLCSKAWEQSHGVQGVHVPIKHDQLYHCLRIMECVFES